MSSLKDTAEQIANSGRAAGHHELTVWAALTYYKDLGSVNDAYLELRRMKERPPPRWLVERWACDAGLIDNNQHRHAR